MEDCRVPQDTASAPDYVEAPKIVVDVLISLFFSALADRDRAIAEPIAQIEDLLGPLLQAGSCWRTAGEMLQ